MDTHKIFNNYTIHIVSVDKIIEDYLISVGQIYAPIETRYKSEYNRSYHGNDIKCCFCFGPPKWCTYLGEHYSICKNTYHNRSHAYFCNECYVKAIQLSTNSRNLVYTIINMMSRLLTIDVCNAIKGIFDKLANRYHLFLDL